MEIRRRREFLEAVVGHSPNLRIPEILESAERETVSYDVERRIPGVDLGRALPRLVAAVRRRAPLAYADTAALVRTIQHEQETFGEMLAQSPIRRNSWADFVVSRAEQRLAAGRPRLIGKLDRPERALESLYAMLATVGRSCSFTETIILRT
jgi:hypothetical protein